MSSVEIKSKRELELQVNAEDIDEAYLACLNLCFPGWGDRSTFAWAFRRSMQGCPMPDLLTLRQDGMLVAGSAITYRRLTQPDGGHLLAGIMTGSWTLPEARGQGCFSQMIASSQQLLRAHAGDLLLAFVTATNPSRFQLEKAGAEPLPTSYFKSRSHAAGAGADATTRLTRVDADMDSFLKELWSAAESGSFQIRYSRYEDWKGQFINRPWRSVLYKDDYGSAAIVEQHSTTDKLLLWKAAAGREIQFLKMLAARSDLTHKDLVGFSSAGEHTRCFRDAGFDEQPGYLTSMRVQQKQQLVPSPTDVFKEVHGGRRGGTYVELENEWLLQSGDRM